MPTLPINLYKKQTFNFDNDLTHSKTPTPNISFDEFFAYQAQNPNQRIELINGQIIPMAGGSAGHSKIATRIVGKVDDYLEQHHPHCHAYGSDFAVQTKKNQLRYPDFLVACNVSDEDKFTASPILVGEVLSEKSTANFDQKQKLAEYKGVVSIQEIVFISQTKKHVVVYRRNGYIFTWSMAEYTQGKILFESINFHIDIDDIYKRMNFDGL